MHIGDSISSLDNGTLVHGHARIINKRIIGKIAFFDVRFRCDHIQLILRKELANYEELISVSRGSLLHISGEKMVTRAGTPSIKVNQAEILHEYDDIMPEKHHGLNMMSRYRNRVDYLLINEDAFLFTQKMSQALFVMRQVLAEHGFQEFLTGVLQSTFEAGQANPFETHCNARNKKLYLSLTSELKLKRLLVAGFNSVYEIGQSFRNEGIDHIHSPEFTMLEAYAVDADCASMMCLLEEIVSDIVLKCEGAHVITSFDETGDVSGDVSYSLPFERLTFEDAFQRYVGELSMCNIDSLTKQYPEMFNAGMTKFTWLMKVIEKMIVPNIHNPTFLTELPSGMSPFAKKKEDNRTLSDRAFLVSQGLFLADIYSDENNVNELIRALENQSLETGNELNSEYLEVMRYGLPSTAGIGLGINRLLMLLLGVLPRNIKETILYPII